MTTSISQIRAVINILSPDDLADNVIQAAIDRAHAYVSDLAGRSSATQDIINAAELNHSAYLAYQAYADRVVQQLPGMVNDQGIFDPAAAVLLRATRDKLDGLKQISDESIAYLQYNFPKNEVAAVIPMADAENYPDQYKMSTFRSSW